MTGHRVPKCSRCNRRYRNQPDWNFTARRGYIVGFLCTDCQTPEENAEAEINLATLEYDIDERERLVGRPRAHPFGGQTVGQTN